jgi:hypothetical protein
LACRLHPDSGGRCDAANRRFGRLLSIVISSSKTEASIMEINSATLRGVSSTDAPAGQARPILVLDNIPSDYILIASRLATGRSDQASGGGAGSGSRGRVHVAQPETPRWSAGEAQAPTLLGSRVLARHAEPRSQGAPKGARSAGSRGASSALHFRENEDKGFSETPNIGPAKRWLVRDQASEFRDQEKSTPKARAVDS